MKLALCIALCLFKLFLVTGFLDKNESKLQVSIKNEVQRRQLRSSAQGRPVPFVFPARFETSHFADLMPSYESRLARLTLLFVYAIDLTLKLGSFIFTYSMICSVKFNHGQV